MIEAHTTGGVAVITNRLRDLMPRPLIVAPMAGGATTPALVAAAAEAGALGVLAGGYKSVEVMTGEIRAVRTATDRAFGLNLFVPAAPAADPDSVAAYAASLADDAARLGARPGRPEWDDDGWGAKLAAVLADPPPFVSFTFGCPSPDIIAALRGRGVVVAVTVTYPEEARLAAAAGADCLCLQGIEAGGHRATFANDHTAMTGLALADLLAATAAVTDLPLIAAGGIMDAGAAKGALSAGASAVQCGTAFLRSRESGADLLHKAALADPRFDRTALTRAFSGRPARGLVNRFMLNHPAAPAAYPDIHHVTRPLRAAAARSGDPDGMSLWAGTGYRQATALAAGEIIERLWPAG